MSQPADLARRRQKLDAAFDRANGLPAEDLELRADFARYLTVLVYGYLEQSVLDLLQAYVNRKAAPPVARYVQRRLERGRNLKVNQLLELLGAFDSEWRIRCEGILDDRSRLAIDTVTNNRNQIAHGEWVGATLLSVSNGYVRIRQVVERLPDVLEPSPG